MQLNITTDYAIRIVNYLSEVPQASALELSEKLGISRTYITQMITRLDLMESYIKPITGAGGGYRLKSSSKEISLLDIINKAEKMLFISSCLGDEHYCDSCKSFSKMTCPIKNSFQNVETILEERLSAINFYDLLEAKEENQFSMEDLL